MRVTFTRLGGSRYGVDVIRDSGPPARLRVAPAFVEYLPHDIAHFLVERAFGLRLGIFGQLAAGGDAGTFWAAPGDRTAKLRQRAHRLHVTGRGDLCRSVTLVAVCTAAWELQTGRRSAPLDGPWPLVDAAEVPFDRVARVVGSFGDVAASWHQLGTGGSVAFDWPAALTFARLRSA